MPSLPTLPVRPLLGLVDRAVEVPGLALQAALQAPSLAGRGYAEVRRVGVQKAVLSAVGAGVSGAAAVATGVLLQRAREQQAAAAQERATPAQATPAGPPVGEEALRAGAPGVNTAVADAAEAAVQAGAGEVDGADLGPADLPIADYDHLTLGSLRGRMIRLDVDQLVLLRAYEQAHADRLQVVTMLENRIAKLRAAAQTAAASGAAGVEDPATPVTTPTPTAPVTGPAGRAPGTPGTA